LEEIAVTKIDPNPTLFGDMASSARRGEADNQRDNWLRQMELAQLAEMGRGAMPPASPKAGAHSIHSMLQPGAAQPHPAARATAAPSEPEHSSATGAAREHSHADGAPSDEQESGTASAKDGSEPDDSSRPAAATLPQVSVLAAVPAGASLAAQANAITAAPSMRNSALPDVAGQRLQPQIAALTARAALPGTLPPRAAEAETQEAPADAHEAADSAQPDWQKRMLHLTGQGDDVAVWIRDQELTPAQSQLLLARVAADVAGMGLRLKGATINGKPALRDGVAEPDHPAAGSDDGAPLIPSTTEQQHVSR
jgi:hypothetical protein